MTVERLDKGTGRKLGKPAPARLDNNRVVKGRPDGQKEPLEFVNTRLLKKLKVRRAIREGRNRPDGA